MENQRHFEGERPPEPPKWLVTKSVEEKVDDFFIGVKNKAMNLLNIKELTPEQKMENAYQRAKERSIKMRQPIKPRIFFEKNPELSSYDEYSQINPEWEEWMEQYATEQEIEEKWHWQYQFPHPNTKKSVF